MNVLVTDGENRSSLAVARSLGRRGCCIFVAGKELGNISMSSKFCRKAFKVPDPMTDGSAYSRAIAEIAVREKIDVIFPMTEQSIYCLNNVRAQLGESLVLACAPPEKMEAVSNKYKLFQMAKKLCVDVPETIFVNGADDFPAKRTGISDFPVVVKPSFSKIVDGERIISGGVMYAADPAELTRLYETKPILRYPSLIQELIVGQGTGLFTLYDIDRHLALFSHRRLLEKPPSGGVSVLSESVPLDDGMVEAAGRLLAEVRWPGVAMVEFKRDVRDGKAKLMEINGRLWGSLQLAVSSGVDFPALCLDYYLGKKPASLMSDYRVGFKLKWFLGILDHIVIRLKKGKHLQQLPPETPALWQVTRELFKARNTDTSFDVFEWKDMKPFVSEAKAYMRNLF
jgi:predicted ATP-grasp superfamily ATP-dependent carboligase